MIDNKKFYTQLEDKIQKSYEEGTTLELAERLAAEFLYAQLKVSEELKVKDLDSRMKKAGLKAIKAAVYKDTASIVDGKKPTEAAIEATINMHKVVQTEQDVLDNSEVEKAYLERMYNIFHEAHVLYRGVAKGKFE